MDDANQRATSLRPGQFYGRYANPTVRSFEEAIAELEGAEDAMAFASGMGAIAHDRARAVLGGLATSSPSASSTPARWRSCRGRAPRFGIETTLVDGTVPGAFAAAVQPGRTMLVLAETPSNPRLELSTSTSSARSPARSRSSTRRSPRRSASSRWRTASTSCCTRRRRASPATTTPRSASSPASVTCSTRSGRTRVLHGATASPFDALNALRGIRTLAVRTAHQAATAQRLAEWLEQHPAVSAVHYPGLASHPQHDLAKRQMRQFGTVLAFDLAGGQEAVRHLFDTMRLAACATSLGGPETLVCHPMTTTHVSLTPEEQADRGRHARSGADVGRPGGRRRPRRRHPTALALTPRRRVTISPDFERRPRRSGARRGRTRTSSTATRRSAVATSRSPLTWSRVRRPRRERANSYCVIPASSIGSPSPGIDDCVPSVNVSVTGGPTGTALNRATTASAKFSGTLRLAPERVTHVLLVGPAVDAVA